MAPLVACTHPNPGLLAATIAGLVLYVGVAAVVVWRMPPAARGLGIGTYALAVVLGGVVVFGGGGLSGTGDDVLGRVVTAVLVGGLIGFAAAMLRRRDSLAKLVAAGGLGAPAAAVGLVGLILLWVGAGNCFQ